MTMLTRLWFLALLIAVVPPQRPPVPAAPIAGMWAVRYETLPARAMTAHTGSPAPTAPGCACASTGHRRHRGAKPHPGSHAHRAVRRLRSAGEKTAGPAITGHIRLRAHKNHHHTEKRR